MSNQNDGVEMESDQSLKIVAASVPDSAATTTDNSQRSPSESRPVAKRRKIDPLEMTASVKDNTRPQSAECEPKTDTSKDLFTSSDCTPDSTGILQISSDAKEISQALPDATVMSQSTPDKTVISQPESENTEKSQPENAGKSQSDMSEQKCSEDLFLSSASTGDENKGEICTPVSQSTPDTTGISQSIPENTGKPQPENTEKSQPENAGKSQSDISEQKCSEDLFLSSASTGDADKGEICTPVSQSTPDTTGISQSIPENTGKPQPENTEKSQPENEKSQPENAGKSQSDMSEQKCSEDDLFLSSASTGDADKGEVCTPVLSADVYSGNLESCDDRPEGSKPDISEETGNITGFSTHTKDPDCVCVTCIFARTLDVEECIAMSLGESSEDVGHNDPVTDIPEIELRDTDKQGPNEVEPEDEATPPEAEVDNSKASEGCIDSDTALESGACEEMEESDQAMLEADEQQQL
jgi:hypothetical protein